MTDPSKVLPPGVMEALKAGNKIEAIKRLRAASGGGLGEAKALIDAVEHHLRAGAKPQGGGKQRNVSMPHAKHPNPPLMRRPGLSPGEEPRAGGNPWWILVLVAVGAVMYFIATGKFN